MPKTQSFLNPPNLKYKINLHTVWKQAGEPTLTSISRETGLAFNTVKAYVHKDGYEMADLSNQYLLICVYFGTDWKQHVQSVEFEEEDHEAAA